MKPGYLILAFVILSGCYFKKYEDPEWRLQKFSSEKTTLKKEGDNIICIYDFEYDEPASIDEEYGHRVKITFQHDSLLKPEALYRLPHKGIVAHYDYLGIWAALSGSVSGNLHGSIKVVKYREQDLLKLNLNLVHPDSNRVKIAVKGDLAFHSIK